MILRIGIRLKSRTLSGTSAGEQVSPNFTV